MFRPRLTVAIFCVSVFAVARSGVPDISLRSCRARTSDGCLSDPCEPCRLCNNTCGDPRTDACDGGWTGPSGDCPQETILIIAFLLLFGLLTVCAIISCIVTLYLCCRKSTDDDDVEEESSDEITLLSP